MFPGGGAARARNRDSAQGSSVRSYCMDAAFMSFQLKCRFA
jgi:hypothetical protein